MGCVNKGVPGVDKKANQTNQILLDRVREDVIWGMPGVFQPGSV